MYGLKRTAPEAFPDLVDETQVSNERSAKAAKNLTSNSFSLEEIKSRFVNVLASAGTSTDVNGVAGAPASTPAPAPGATTTPAVPNETSTVAQVTVPKPQMTEVDILVKNALDKALREAVDEQMRQLQSLQQPNVQPGAAATGEQDPEKVRMAAELQAFKKDALERSAMDAKRYGEEIQNEFGIYLPKINKKLLEMGINPEEHIRNLGAIFANASKNPFSGEAVALKQLVVSSASASLDDDKRVAQTASKYEAAFQKEVEMQKEIDRLRSELDQKNQRPAATQPLQHSNIPVTTKSPTVATAGGLQDKVNLIPLQGWREIQMYQAAYPELGNQAAQLGLRTYLDTKYLEEKYRYNPYTGKKEEVSS